MAGAHQQASVDVVVRRARTSDVPDIKRLVDTYAGRILLEKNLVTLYEAVQETWVAELDGELRTLGRWPREADTPVEALAESTDGASIWHFSHNCNIQWYHQ